LWLAGESYAGHYLPNLALEIAKGNRNFGRKINFKGFLVGTVLGVMLMVRRYYSFKGSMNISVQAIR
jgi:carboxypeptidase C (cathepsin A)